MATELILIRHGETEWNKKLKFQGQKDIPLSVKGYKQAEKVSQYLAAIEIDQIYTSDLKRAYQTTQKINQFHNQKLNKEKGLREICFGNWEGLTYKEIKKKNPDKLKKWENKPECAPPDGESLHTFKKRLENTFDEIIVNNEDKSILIVTHGGSIRVFLTIILGIPVQNYWQFSIENTGISIVKIYDGDPVVHRLNDISHL